MRELVDDVLLERRARLNPRRRWLAGGLAFSGHAVLGALIALAPVFAARGRTEVRDYMRVMIVPAKALGVSNPAPTPSPPKPKPAPVAVPKPEARKPAASTKRQAPTVATPAAAASSATNPAPSETNQAPNPSERSQRHGGPDGTAFGTSPFGSSEASLDDPNFQYGYYIQQMLALIGGHWLRPRANPGTEMVIHYRIERSGRLVEIKVVKESGNRAFDAAGLRAVTLASPLPPLPQSYRSDSLGVNLVIR